MGQLGQNIVIAYKAESTIGVAAASGAGAKTVRLNPSQGLSLARVPIQPGEIRQDMLTPKGRLGSKSVSGGYTGDTYLGAWDDWLEAIMRSTYTASSTVTEATMTSITTTTSTIVAAGGSWITQGVRVGQVVRLTNHSEAANNNKNLRVTALTATTITVAETLTAQATPDTTFTLTILKRLTNGTTPTRRSYTIEQYHQDLDLSELYTGCRISSVTFRGAPDQMATVEWGVVGMDGENLTTGTSPYFTSPTANTSVGLTWVDSTIRYAGANIATATGFELTLTNNAATQPVIGSLASPDVYDNRLQVSGQLTMMREDLQNLGRLRAETEVELHVMLLEPDTEPKDVLSIFVPSLLISSANAPMGQEGAMIETVAFTGGLKTGTTGYADTMVQFSTSAA